jgi:hypothetical protein
LRLVAVAPATTATSCILAQEQRQLLRAVGRQNRRQQAGAVFGFPRAAVGFEPDGVVGLRPPEQVELLALVVDAVTEPGKRPVTYDTAQTVLVVPD